jgi:hypothetical protein
MKKKSASQSAFFNLRVLIGLFTVLAGVFLALVGFGAFPAAPASTAKAQQRYNAQKYDPNSKRSIYQLVPPGFDCSQIYKKGIHKMENLRAGAIMIFCGEAQGGKPSPAGAFSKFVKDLLPSPLAYGVTDANLITTPESFPNITQSETMTAANPDNPFEIVVAYNDSRDWGAFIDISAASVSTDGGNTFARLTLANGRSPFADTTGDPVVLYNRSTGSWLTVWIGDGLCGGGLGGFKSTTPWDPNSWSHFCVNPNSFDDRESGWADNTTTSPFFGRLYVSWNDFDTANADIFVRFSTDDGVTWTARQVSSGGFFRNVQITGDLATGDVYIASMDEMGGGLTNRANRFYKSTDGGNSWSLVFTGTTFPAPGVTTCPNSYFACMFTDQGGYWRHMGWGQPAALNGIVHYVYDQHGSGSDPADVYYIRSTDGGLTFSTPLKLNTDTTTRPQWQPNVSVAIDGSVFAVWYDGRETASCVKGDENVPCYRMWARKSTDNGATWLADMEFSDVVTPLPGQPDPGIIAEYAGDYDYSSSVLRQHLHTWTDGRVTINSQSQQDAFFDREPISAGMAVVSSDPACGSVVFPPAPTDFVVNTTDPVQPATLQASDFTVNGTPANSVDYTPGTTTMTFRFTSTPVVGQGPQAMHIPAGAFLRDPDGDPVLEFSCDFLFDEVLLAVTDTVPPVGGTFSPPAPNTYTYDVNWNEAVDPASVEASDLTLSGATGATVTNVQVVNGDMTTRFTLDIQFGGSLTASIDAGAITDAFGNPNDGFSGNYTVEGCPPAQYVITPGTDTIVPGTTDIGNHTDDGSTFVSLPFPFTLYDQTYNGVYVDSNGRLDFVCTAAHSSDWVSVCLPATDTTICPYTYTVFGLWTDQCTDNTPGACGGDNCTGCGIFTSVSGNPPDRIFNIEWRTVLYGTGGTTPDVHHEVRLYENPNQNLRFDVIYGDINSAAATQMWVAGVQKDEVSGFFTEDFCIPVGGTPPTNESRTYDLPPCGSPSPTPTATASPTATATATATATPTATATTTATSTPTATATATTTATPTSTVRPTPTPRAKPTPRPAPTPGPRPTVKPSPWPPPSPTP